MLQAAGLGAAVPPMLPAGEDDALVDVAGFQLAVGVLARIEELALELLEVRRLRSEP
jgi:hypothetical protein